MLARFAAAAASEGMISSVCVPGVAALAARALGSACSTLCAGGGQQRVRGTAGPGPAVGGARGAPSSSCSCGAIDYSGAASSSGTLAGLSTFATAALSRPAPGVGAGPSAAHSTFAARRASSKGQEWRVLQGSGAKINPCNSPFHPAVSTAGIKPESEPTSVQEAYDPNSKCFGCGPRSEIGLHLKSYRYRGAPALGGLEAKITIDQQYLAFPGVVSGGVLTTMIQCHGNWTAAIALMDAAHVSKPPLTMTKSVLVSYKEPTPPGEELLMQSEVISIRDDGSKRGGPTVEVDITIYHKDPITGERKTLVTASGFFKRLGALRAL